MSRNRIVIAGTGSGVGKTTLTIGLMAALKKKGFIIQGFKCGPDYIDPTYHTAVTGRSSRNMDSWMLTDDTIREIVVRASKGADLSIIEGVMGFFDGKSPLDSKGSTAELSMITESPVILVVDVSSMARSAAAIVKGFQALEQGPNIVGVIANQVGSRGHYEIVKAAIEKECHVPVIGYMIKDPDLHLPSRHLGLVPALERGEMQDYFSLLADRMTETIDLDYLYELAKTTELVAPSTSMFNKKAEEVVSIAVAKDAAFNFYYQENLELLEAYGAKLCYFSPLHGEEVPEGVDGLYIGGGFPEEFASILAINESVKQSIRNAIERGVRTLAECGGFMYLTEVITTTDQNEFPMVGLIPGKVIMKKTLASLGYREIFGTNGNFLIHDNEVAKGHEFHYSTFESSGPVPFAYKTVSRFGKEQEGYVHENLVAGYTHFHFASNPTLVQNWIHACKQYKYEREKRRMI